MNDSTPQARPRTKHVGTSGLMVAWLALIVPWGLLTALGHYQWQTWQAAAGPYVYQQILLSHLLAILPLTLGMGWWLGRWLPQDFKGVVLCVAAGATAIGWVGWQMYHWPPQLLDAGRAVSTRAWSAHGLRWGAVLMLQLPWTTWAALRIRRRGVSLRLIAYDAVIALLLAVLPLIHVQQLTRRESVVVTDLVVNKQFARALPICQRLVAMGRDRIADQVAGDLYVGLRDVVAQLRSRVATPLPADASVDLRLDRAMALYQLNRNAEAERYVAAIADDQPRAGMQYALIAESNDQHELAAERYGQVIELLAQRSNLSDAQRAILRGAYERRANNLRRINQGRQAERELREGLERWPESQDAFLMQLGYHYQMAGRANEAIEYFRRAAELNPALQERVDLELTRLKDQAQGCLIRSSRGATR